MNTINIDDFSKVEIRIGTVLEATKVPDADRLIQLIFDFGSSYAEASEGKPETVIANEVKQSSSNEIASSPSVSRNDAGFTRLPELAEKYPGREVRQIMSAIAPFIPDPSTLVGKQIAVCTNLEPRKFRGYVSQGMILALGDETTGLSLLIPEKPVEPGARLH